MYHAGGVADLRIGINDERGAKIPKPTEEQRRARHHQRKRKKTMTMNGMIFSRIKKGNRSCEEIFGKSAKTGWKKKGLSSNEGK